MRKNLASTGNFCTLLQHSGVAFSCVKFHKIILEGTNRYKCLDMLLENFHGSAVKGTAARACVYLGHRKNTGKSTEKTHVYFTDFITSEACTSSIGSLLMANFDTEGLRGYHQVPPLFNKVLQYLWKTSAECFLLSICYLAHPKILFGSSHPKYRVCRLPSFHHRVHIKMNWQYAATSRPKFVCCSTCPEYSESCMSVDDGQQQHVCNWKRIIFRAQYNNLSFCKFPLFQGPNFF
uniref:Uncharacterized protein n=1 Tax=Ixodes ricinus TaxID=34613 RepID=A0A6B0V4R6_IXORI